MMQSILKVVCLFAILSQISICQVSQTNNTQKEHHHPAIYIIAPDEAKLRIPTINYSAADFGFIPYGHRIFGQVVLAEPFDACQPLMMPKLPLQPPSNNDMQMLSTIILAIRGNCTFVRKAYNAQQIGASMLIVIDQNENEDVDFVMMVSDHTLQVQIPTVMITKSDGDKLLSEIARTKPSKPLTIMTKFHIAHNEKVELQYHLSSLDKNSYHFLTQFKPFYEALEQSINFQPQYVIFECGMCKVYNWTVSNDNCISGGRYCAPEGDVEFLQTGRDAVLEDLRQLCAFKVDSKKWWQYMSLFSQNCLHSLPINLSTCSSQMLNMSGFDQSRVDSCVVESYDTNNANGLADNNLLKGARDQLETNPIYMWPSLYINGMFYKGDLYFENKTQLEPGYYNVSNYASLEAICAAFSHEHQPALCDYSVTVHVTESGQIEKSNNSFNRLGNQSSSVGILLWIGVVFGLIVVMALSFFLYRRMLRREMHQELQSQVDYALSNYYKMDQSGRTKSDEV